MNKKYIIPDYLLSAFDENGNLVIYNTLYYNTFIVKRADVDSFKKICENIVAKGTCDPQYMNFLLDHNFIVDENYDIHTALASKYVETFMSKKILSLIILPTEKCNFKCLYCYEDHNHGKMSKECIDRILTLLNKLMPEYDMLNISWFGGEPLLEIGIIEYIMTHAQQICKLHKKPIYSMITTNGYLLDTDIMQKLLKLHIMKFQITLDGNRTTHNYNRPHINGGNTYDVILNNLLDIKRKIKTKTIQIIIRINVGMSTTSDEINDIASNFRDDSRFVINIQRIFGSSKPDTLCEISHTRYFDLIRNCNEYLSDELTSDNTVCYAAKENTLMVRADGSLGKCTVNFNDPSNYFGNIKDINIDSFDLSKLSYCNSIITDKCIRCRIYPLCFGRQCPARRNQICDQLIEKYRIHIKNNSMQAVIWDMHK